MLMEKIQLWEDNEYVNLFTYVLNNSQEFRANEKRPAVIICPGGAYLGTSDREAEPVAMRFAAQGYHTFVLRYNTYFTEWVSDFNNLPKGNEKTRYPGPLFDLAKAMMVIKENADKWFVDSDKISICGFSAGAHLCASMGVHWQDEFLIEKFKVPSETFKPNTVILGYPLLDYTLMKEKLNESSDEMGKGLFKISNTAVFGTLDPSDEELEKLSPANYITLNTPPTFIWHTAEDSLVYVENSLKFALQLTKNKIPYELHVFENGPHGLSLCDETTAGEERHINPHAGVWFDIALSWMKKYN
ncbi:MAG: alpha/beta hydrolase [Clostridiaceae bacterium]